MPYKVPTKKGKNKEVPESREGLRRRVPLGNRSGDAATTFVQDEDEEESTSSRSKKRTASEDGEEVQPSLALKRR